MTLRANFRLQLQKQQAQEQERREQLLVQEQDAGRSVSSAIQTPGASSSNQQFSASVPPHVLQVGGTKFILFMEAETLIHCP